MIRRSNSVGGGGVRKSDVNAFTQMAEPAKKDGIWLKQSEKFKQIILDKEVFASGDWIPHNEIKDMPTARYGFGCIEYADKVYCIGGYKNGNTGVVEVYDIDTNTWSAKANMPTARNRFGCVEYEGKIYCIGGIVSKRVNTVEIYDIATNTWSTGASLPQPKGEFGCTEYQGKIYCIGGISEIWTQSLYVYNIATNTWSSVSDIPYKNAYFSCVGYENRIYCLGGYNSTESIDNVGIYNISTNTWSTGTSMPSKKHSFGCIERIGKIYCICGTEQLLSSENNFLDTVYVYDISSNTWDIKNNASKKISLFGCTLSNDKIYCIGGYNGSAVNTMEIYSFISKQYPEDTLVINVPANLSDTKYTTALITNKIIQGEKPQFFFNNAWLFKNGNLMECESYYGNGCSWKKFKN